MISKLGERPPVIHPAAVREAFAADVRSGLGTTPKQLKCKYFYDERGAVLFDRICELPEYYLTRTEMRIMEQHVAEMADAIGRDAVLIELGSGSAVKTRMLLDHLPHAAGYIPIDIAEGQLSETAATMAAAYPHLEVIPLCADFTARLQLPDLSGGNPRRCLYFPGSTIGNFEPDQAVRLLRRLHETAGAEGCLLIGLDLHKDPAVLHAAYNDAAGITAAFNLNLLDRINRELAGTFVPERFAHYAFYNPQRRRIEMHLVSRDRQNAFAAGQQFTFSPGESIFTESSYKHDSREFARLCREAGFNLRRQWTDSQQWFALQLYDT